MGLDFTSKTQKSFQKGLDKSRIELGTPDLFTQHPDREPRAYAAKIRENRQLRTGEDLCVRLEGGGVVAQRGMDIVAEFNAPPTELVEALKESYGEACGTVQEVYEIAETAEISVC